MIIDVNLKYEEHCFCDEINFYNLSDAEFLWINSIYGTDFSSRQSFFNLVSTCPKSLQGTRPYCLFIGMYYWLKCSDASQSDRQLLKDENSVDINKNIFDILYDY